MRKVKQIFIITALTLSCHSFVLAQEDEATSNFLNTAYVEFLGNSYIYSVNYERKFIWTPKISFSGRIGASYLEFWLPVFENFTFIYFPLTLNVIRHFNNKNNFEAGIGLANEFTNETDDVLVYNFIPTFHLGYRGYMKNNIDFRTGINLSRAQLNADDRYDLFPWPYISVGKNF